MKKVIFALLAFLLGVGAYFYMNNSNQKKKEEKENFEEVDEKFEIDLSDEEQYISDNTDSDENSNEDPSNHDSSTESVTEVTIDPPASNNNTTTITPSSSDSINSVELPEISLEGD